MRFSRQAGTVLFAFALLFATGTYCQKYKKDSLPKPVGYVNDFERIFSGKQVNYLDSAIGAFERKTTIQIALITIDTSMIDLKDFEDYVLRIFNTWGVGLRSKNNGIVVAISKGYRFMRIETGYGLEGLLTDNEAKKIIDNEFIPLFKKGLYFEGTTQGLRAIMKKVEVE
jgi:uncharacterized protein